MIDSNRLVTSLVFCLVFFSSHPVHAVKNALLLLMKAHPGLEMQVLNPTTGWARSWQTARLANLPAKPHFHEFVKAYLRPPEADGLLSRTLFADEVQRTLQHYRPRLSDPFSLDFLFRHSQANGVRVFESPSLRSRVFSEPRLRPWVREFREGCVFKRYTTSAIDPSWYVGTRSNLRVFAAGNSAGDIPLTSFAATDGFAISTNGLAATGNRFSVALGESGSVFMTKGHQVLFFNQVDGFSRPFYIFEGPEGSKIVHFAASSDLNRFAAIAHGEDGFHLLSWTSRRLEMLQLEMPAPKPIRRRGGIRTLTGDIEPGSLITGLRFLGERRANQLAVDYVVHETPAAEIFNFSNLKPVLEGF